MTISRCNMAGLRLLLGLALLVTTWFALSPAPALPMEGPLSDKLAHALAFFVLALLTDLSWPMRGFDSAKWLSLIAYGIAIEFAQALIPSRLFSVADILADLAGVALYASAGVWLTRRLAIR